MKRFLALAALVLGLASCQTEPEGLNVNVGGEVDTVVTVTIPETETRAGGNNSALSIFDNGVLGNENDNKTMRYILEIYYKNELFAERLVDYSDGKTVTFPVRLVPGRQYNFVVWADYVESNDDTDFHYNTKNKVADNYYGLTNVTLIDTEENPWEAMDETRDAFTGFLVVDSYSGSQSINIPLIRPFAKLRVITTDMVELGNLNITPVSAKVTYSAFSHESFNALNGEYSNAKIATKTHTYAIADYADFANTANKNSHKVLFTDYFFAADNDIVKFELDVYEGDVNNQTPTTLIKHNDFKTDIPAKRNYLTTIQGHILTEGNNIEVTVNGAFENVDNGNTTDPDYDYTTISSEKEFMDAIDKGGNYILISDINITGVSATSLAATRAAGNGTTINLNGYTIKLQKDIVVPAGKTLIINDEPNDEGNEEGTIISAGGAIVNEGKLNIEGGAFGANTIENNNGEVNITGGTISQGAITGGANITGGEFTYNPENEIPDGYKVVETENGKYEVRVGDPIAKIGDVEYTTIQAAIEAAEGETTITLTAKVILKNTVVIAEGKNITLDLANNTLSAADKNVIRNDGGNLTIKNGTVTRTGDVVGYSVNNASGEITVEDATIKRGLYTSGSKMTATNANISHEQSSRHAIYAWNCEVTINSGTYHNDNAGNATLMASGSSVVTINGGTFSIADGRSSLGWTSCMIDQNGTANVTVKGGLFNGGFRINSADTTLTIEGGEFNTNNGSGYTDYSGTKVVKGGKFTDDGALNWAKKYIAEGYVFDEDTNTVVLDVKIAKVGNTEYRKIDDAIAAWTNNTTLTLLADVTLNDVITLKSTEYHILDLGTYTMTAASKKDAISISNESRSSASYALDIKADATNPGGITATGKAVVKTTGKSGVKDRPIIRFYNGVYNASNVISHSGSNGTNCPQFQFHGGVFNGTISANRALIQIYGGTFNSSLYISVDSSAYALISGGKFKQLSNLYGSALNSDKFTIGSAKGVFDRGIYVDDEGYFVVGGEVITDFGDKFAAKVTKTYGTNDYLKYSSAAANGLYYTNADMAIKKHGEDNVVLKAQQ